jgi:hypothetical protein
VKDLTFCSRIPAGIKSEADVTNILNQHKYQGRKNWRFKDHHIKFLDEQFPVDWFYAVQVVMELMTPSPLPQTLPGAEKFYKFLCHQAGGAKITVHHPIVLGISYDMDYCKSYKVFADEKRIGEYKTFGPKSGASDYTREYSGIIPGKPGKPKLMSLIWSDEHFKSGRHSEGDPGRIVKTEWKRQDGWKEIPFP